MAKFNTKRLKVFLQDTLYRNDIDGVSLSEVIDRLIELQKKHGKDAKFGLEVDGGDCYGANAECSISSEHIETDEEYNKRYEMHLVIERAERDRTNDRRKSREDRDRRDYARLKKKFEKK